MNPTTNALQQMMDWYRSQFSRKDNNQFDPAAGDNQTGRALNWAMQMMQSQQQPQGRDYYSEEVPGAVKPFVAPQQPDYSTGLRPPRNALSRMMGGR